jgi:hypothetical protein
VFKQRAFLGVYMHGRDRRMALVMRDILYIVHREALLCILLFFFFSFHHVVLVDAWIRTSSCHDLMMK